MTDKQKNTEKPAVGAVAEALILEGASKVWSDAMIGQHTEGHQVGLLALHNFIDRDGTKQPIEQNPYYDLFREDNIPVTALSRQIQADSKIPVYTQADLDKLDAFTRDKGIITTLEQHPLKAIQQLDGDKLPPILVNLFRSGDPEFKTELEIAKLKSDVEKGRVVGFTVDSDASKESYVKRGISPDSITVIYNGIDTDRFVPSEVERARVREELGIPIDAPTVLIISRFGFEKGIDLFLESAKLYLEKVPKAHAIMVGAGLALGDKLQMDEENPELKAMVAETFGGDTDASRRLHGVGRRKDIASFYPAADVLALTSITESRPLCISEAQASGLGVAVSTDVGDARGMVAEHGFITGRDPEEVAAKWQEAYDRRKEIGFPLERREELATRRMILHYEDVINNFAK